MSFEPANGEMTQVHFSDEDHAYEGGGPGQLGNDSDALIEQLDGMDNYHLQSRKKSNTLCKVLCVLVPVLSAVGVGLYFALRPNSSSGGGASVVAPPANLEARCATASDECKQACEPAECCDFPANLQLSCLAGNEKTCLKYHTFCAILKPGGEAPTAPTESIPPPPANLKDLCTVASIGTVDGFTECQEACQPAECCIRDDDLCHDASCHAYAPCLVMSTSSKVQPDVIAPHVKEECSDLTTADGRTNCRIACSHALCCFLGGESASSCPHPDDSFCDQYQICNDLEKDVDIKSSPKEIKQICTESAHTSLCEVVCERGACCFASERCPTEDIKCNDYLTDCSGLYGDTRDDDGGLAEEEQSTGGGDSSSGGGGGDSSSGGGDDTGSGGTTDDGGDDTGGPDASGGGGGDSADDVGGDDSDDNDTGIVFKADVDDACIEYDPASPSAATSECHLLCENVGCCFSGDGCGSAIVNCKTYEACTVVYNDSDDEGNTSSGGGDDSDDSGGSGAVFKADVDDACMAYDSASPSAATSECHMLCENVGCCFSGDGCGSAAVNCKTYEACTVVYNDSDDEGNGGGTSTGGGSGGGTSGGGSGAGSLETACDNHVADSVSLPDQQTQCETMCEKYTCCYEVNDCPAAQTLDCNKGAACKAVWGDGGKGGNVPSTSDGSSSEGGGTSGAGGGTTHSIDDACDNHVADSVSVPDQITPCETMCEKYTCCFEVNDCPAKHDLDCSKGDACKALWGDGATGPGGPSTPSDGSSSGGGSTGGTTGGSTGGSTEDSTGGPSGDSDSAIMEACEFNDGEPEQDSLCHQLCDAYKCCFGVNNCEIPAGTDCSAGSDCEILWASDAAGGGPVDGGGSQPEEDHGDDSIPTDDPTGGGGDEGANENHSKDDIDAACSGDAVSSMCSFMCDPAECCFRASMSCKDGLDCTKFGSCTKVWERRRLLRASSVI